MTEHTPAGEREAMETLRGVRICAASWEPDVRLLGNVRAGDIVRAIDALATRPTPAPAEGGWQPIATAPKDGTQIFVARDMGPHGWILGTAHWREVAGLSGWFSWGIAGGSELGLAHPTHWMPLPQPPKEAP